LEEKLSLRERYERQLNELLEKAGISQPEERAETSGLEERLYQSRTLQDDAENAGAAADEEIEDEKLRSIREQLDPRIRRALSDMGFETLTPIQEQAIPSLLEGKDIIGQAQTGTGKTAAFGIPLIARVDPSLQKLQAVVLCPTRELAIQAAEELRKIAKYIEGLRILPVYGGQDITRQIRALPGVQIIVGTPGRVMDHMNRHTVKLEQVSMVVLDEADEMLNMGFREDMEVILGAIPGEHQTALFSATMPKPILEITKQFQKDAVNVKVTAEELTIPLVSQKYFLVKSKDKDAATVRLLEYYQPRLCLIFCNTKMKVEELAEVLKKNDFQAEGLHGDLIQHQRDIVMGRFRNGSTNILIATDVAARGIDVDDVEIVINYDIPKDNEYYVHRIGRTGRAGKSGQSFTFAGARELYRIREIERYCKTTIEEKKLPDPSKVLKSKAKKYLDSAWELREKEEDIELMKVYLRRKMEKDNCDIFDLAACMLKQEIGEKGEEIPEDIPQSKRGRGGRDSGRRGEEGGERRSFGRRGEEGSERRSFGKRSEEGGERRSFGKRGEEGSERRSFGKRGEESGERRSFGKRGEESGERRSFGKRGEEGTAEKGLERKATGRREKREAGEGFFGRRYELLPSRADLDEREMRRSRDHKAEDYKAEDHKAGDHKERERRDQNTERAIEKHLEKKERKGAGAKNHRKGGLDARNVLDVDKYGRPRKVKK